MQNRASRKKRPEPETQERLIATAERLFAEHGLDAVSMRQINREAGQLNTSSIHYYFGSREAVFEAVLERRMSAINRERLALLAEMQADGRTSDLREVVAAYVRPLAAQVAVGEGGNHYVRFLAQAYASTEIDIGRLVRGKWDQSLNEVAALLQALLSDLPDAVFRERLGTFFRSVVYALADRERDILRGRDRPGRLPFPAMVEDLIDTQTAAFGAPYRAK